MTQETEVVQPINEQAEIKEEVKVDAPKQQTFTQEQLDNIIKTRLDAEKSKVQKLLQEEENKKTELLKEQQLKEAKSKADIEKIMQDRLSEKDTELINIRSNQKRKSW